MKDIGIRKFEFVAKTQFLSKYIVRRVPNIKKILLFLDSVDQNEPGFECWNLHLKNVLF